jgi:nucleotide-binding universal stress UspA family protein
MRRILVASDFSLTPDLAFERGCELASEECADLHVLQLTLDRSPRIGLPGAAIESLLASAQERHPCVAGMVHTVGAPSAAAIVAEAERIGADLIVMRNDINAALHDDRPFDLIERVLHRTDIAVLAVSQRCSGPYRRLLAMIDSGREAQAVLETAEMIRSAQTI